MTSTIKTLGKLAPKTRKPSKMRKVDKSKLKITPKKAYEEYFEEGKTLLQIGNEHGAAESTISRAISRYKKEFFNDVAKLDYFKRNKADILEDKLLMLTQAITQAKADSASVKDLTIAQDKINNMIRLERGQATQNIDVFLDTIGAITDATLRKPLASAHCGNNDRSKPIEAEREEAQEAIDMDAVEGEKAYAANESLDFLD